MKIILEVGKGNVNQRRADGNTPLIIAAERNVDPKLMKMLINANGDLSLLRNVCFAASPSLENKLMVTDDFDIGWSLSFNYCRYV
jgi:hypothetical protein